MTSTEASPRGQERALTVRDVLLIVFACSFVLFPFCVERPLFTNDDSLYLAHLSLFDHALREGQLPVRWVSDAYWGYGSPVFLHLHNAVLYLAEPFVLLGLGLTAAIKITWVLVIVSSALAMYLFSREILGRSGAIVSAVVYVHGPWFLGHVFGGGNLSSASSFVLYPLVLLGVRRLSAGSQSGPLVLVAGASALLISSHLINAALFLPFLVLYAAALCLGRRNGRWLVLAALAGICGLGLAGWYVVPAWFESSYVHLKVPGMGIDTSAYRQEFVGVSDLLSSLWRMHWSEFHIRLTDDPLGTADFHLGLFGIVGAIGSFFVYVRSARQSAEWRMHLAYFQVGFLLSTMGATHLSAWVWDAIPALSYAESPYRLLNIANLAMAYLSGAAFSWAIGEWRRGAAKRTALEVCLVLIPAWSLTYFHPLFSTVQDSYFFPELIRASGFHSTGPDTHHYLPIWVEDLPSRSAGGARVLGGTAVVETRRRLQTRIDFAVDTDRSAEIEFDTYYYPGWTCRLGPERAAARPAPRSGLAICDVPAGSARGALVFEQTPPMRFGLGLTALSAALMVAVCVFAGGGRQHEHRAAPPASGPEARVAVPLALAVAALFWCRAVAPPSEAERELHGRVNARLWEMRGDEWAAAGAEPYALICYQRAVLWMPAAANLRAKLARHSAREDGMLVALNEYRAAIAHDPANRDARCALASLYASYGLDSERARAVEPDDDGCEPRATTRTDAARRGLQSLPGRQ